jgi:hypothetical protein
VDYLKGSMKNALKMLHGIKQSQTALMKLITYMDLEEIDTKLDYILERIIMKLFSQVLLLVLFKISLQESKSFSEELKRKKMLINMFKDSLITKMTLLPLTQLVVNLETLW